MVGEGFQGRGRQGIRPELCCLETAPSERAVHEGRSKTRERENQEQRAEGGQVGSGSATISAMRLTPDEWDVARRVCTPEQLEALDWWRRGAGYKRIGVVLGLGRDTARGRVERGLGRIRQASAEPSAHPC